METLNLFENESCQDSISSHLDFLAKTLALPDNELVSKVSEVLYSLKRLGSLTQSDPTILSLKTSRVFSQVTMEKTFSQQLEQSPTLGMTANGNCLILSGFSPKIESGYSLSDIEKIYQDQIFSL